LKYILIIGTGYLQEFIDH